QALLDFADEIRADIGGLGVNAAAKPCKHADETSAKGETNQAAYRRVTSNQLCGDRVKDGHRKQGESHDEQASHSTAVECHSQSFSYRHACSLSRAHIRYDRDAHPNVTRRKRTKRTDQKANRRGAIFEKDRKG